MLREAKKFRNFKLRANDGDIGQVRDFLFDDKHWNVRYAVVDTRGWLMGRDVLISPYALDTVNDAERVLPVKLTKKQIEESPSLQSNEPVSRQYESHYYDYYGWPNYGNGLYAWGAYPYLPRHPPYDRSADSEQDWDPHLRSTTAVAGHHIQALDGELGHVEEFIIDDETWSIRYLVVDTKNWWPGKHVLVSPQWIERVSWDEAKVYLNLSRERIKQAAEYEPATLNRDYETSLYHHYDRPAYWNSERALYEKWSAAGSPR
ncbi:MAG: PRC-barrel domain-containing protein [Polyangiaceae bacterium]